MPVPVRICPLPNSRSRKTDSHSISESPSKANPSRWSAVSQAGALVMRLLRILIVMLAENAVSPMSAAREHDAFTGGFANFPVPNHFVD